MKTYEQLLDESWARSRALDRLAIRWMIYMLASGVAGFFASDTHWAFGALSLAVCIVGGTRLNKIGDATQWEYRYMDEVSWRMFAESVRTTATSEREAQ